MGWLNAIVESLSPDTWFAVGPYITTLRRIKSTMIRLEVMGSIMHATCTRSRRALMEAHE